MPRLVYRSLGQWTDPITDPRESCPFSASWDDTKKLLLREVEQISDTFEVVLEVDTAERNIRQDGFMRADAKVSSPFVVVSFDSKFGPLRYACDTYEQRWYRGMEAWKANVRAVALSLNALRSVQRWGIGVRGEAYTGWAALPPGMPMGIGPAKMTVEEAAGLLHRSAGAAMFAHGQQLEPGQLILDPKLAALAYRAAAKNYHPDNGGDADTFKRLKEARDLLIGTAA